MNRSQASAAVGASLPAVWLCAAPEDARFAEILATALQPFGKEVRGTWERSESTADNLAVPAKIENVQAFLFVVSPETVGNVGCLNELAAAVRDNRTIVRLLRRDVAPGALPPELVPLKAVSFQVGDDFDQALGQLLERIDAELRVDVFISYSRADLEFVDKVERSLWQNGRTTWVDRRKLTGSEEWLNAILAGIDTADNFLFLISPDALVSNYTAQEVSHAATQNKRIIPALIREARFDSAPPEIQSRNAISFLEGTDEEAFQKGLHALLQTLDNDPDWVHTHTEFLVRATTWARWDRDRSYLLRGDDLRRAEQWLADAGKSRERNPTVLQAEYVQASRQDTIRGLRRLVASVSFALVVALTLAVTALVLYFQADERAKIAESRRLAAQSRIEVGTRLTFGHLLALEAYRTRDTVEARGSLLYALQRHPALLAQHRWHDKSVTQRIVYDLAFSPDGRWLASCGADRNIVLTNAATGRPDGEPLRGHDQTVECLAFHPVTPILVSGGGDQLRIWDLNTRQCTAVVDPDLNPIIGTVFSPDGQSLIVCGQDPKVILWDWKGKPVNRRTFVDLGTHAGVPVRPLKLAFSPDGKTAAVACNDGKARLYGAIDGKLTGVFNHDPKGELLWSVQFHPTRPWIATAGRNGEVKLWDYQTGQLLNQEKAFDNRRKSETFALAFSRDGRLLACGTGKPEVEIWDIESGQPVTQLRLHSKDLSAVCFHSKEDRLASAGHDGLVALWDASHFQALASSVPAGAPEYRVAGWAPNGRYLAAAQPEELTVWERSSASDGRGPWQALPRAGLSDEYFFEQLAFSVDGSRVAAGGTDWIVAREVSTSNAFNIGIGAERRKIVALAFTEDRDRVYVLRQSGFAQKWCLSKGELEWEKRFTDFNNVLFGSVRGSDGTIAWQTDQEVRCARRFFGNPSASSDLMDTAAENGRVAFSPDGRLLVWNTDGTTVSWRETDRPNQSPRRIRVGGDLITALAVNHAGTVLATGDASGAVTLWELSTSQMIGASLSTRGGRPNADSITSLSFSNDDRSLASTSDRAGLLTWDVSPDAWAKHSRSVVDCNFTGAEWIQFVGANTPYQKTVEELPIGEGVTEEMLYFPAGWRWWWLAIGLTTWVCLSLFLLPWDALPQFKTSRASRVALLLAVVVVISASLLVAPPIRVSAVPVWGEKVSLALAVLGFTAAAAWMQRWLDCRWQVDEIKLSINNMIRRRQPAAGSRAAVGRDSSAGS